MEYIYPVFQIEDGRKRVRNIHKRLDDAKSHVLRARLMADPNVDEPVWADDEDISIVTNDKNWYIERWDKDAR